MALFSANVCRGSECAPSRPFNAGVNMRENVQGLCKIKKKRNLKHEALCVFTIQMMSRWKGSGCMRSLGSVT